MKYKNGDEIAIHNLSDLNGCEFEAGVIMYAHDKVIYPTDNGKPQKLIYDGNCWYKVLDTNNKDKLIEFINTLPDNLDYFTCRKNDDGILDIKIFETSKGEEYYSKYFGL